MNTMIARVLVRRPLSSMVFKLATWLVTKLLNQRDNHDPPISSKLVGFDGAPNHRGFVGGRDGPPHLVSRIFHLRSDDREDARKIWRFEQMLSENPLTRGFP